MKKYYVLLLTVFSSLILTGCGPSMSKISLKQYNSKIYENQPKSILVLPARNTTTSVDATNNFRYTITKPLAEKGYYVFPVHLVDSFFKSENIYESELIRQIPVSKLKEVFNPDAILYVDINAWDTSYAVVSSHVDVGLSFSLLNAKNGEEIWQNSAYAYSYSGLDGNNGLIGLVVSAISVAINTATDYNLLAYSGNNAGVSMLPAGPYHPDFKKDMNNMWTFTNVASLEDGRLYVDEYFIKGNGSEEKVPLTVNKYAKGYHAFSVHNLNFFNHNGYKNYYVTQEIDGHKYIRNRFFKYENNKPFIFVENKKVFVQTELDGTIPYSEDDGDYYFQVDNVIELSEITKK